MSKQITIPDMSLASLAGYKTYIALAAGAAIIALNHYGLLPPQYTPDGLDPQNWINDEYKLLLGATGRSALQQIATHLKAAVPISDPQKSTGG